MKTGGRLLKHARYYWLLLGREPSDAAAVIIHVFPSSAFYIEDERGNRTKFANAQEAKGKAVGPGNWTAYPIEVRGVVVYFK